MDGTGRPLSLAEEMRARGACRLPGHGDLGIKGAVGKDRGWINDRHVQTDAATATTKAEHALRSLHMRINNCWRD
ncbi:MAG: hypothetical protein QUS08_00610 [Methanothrix sp.]|nr:hypothetical protein [Methanothrix sp.]